MHILPCYVILHGDDEVAAPLITPPEKPAKPEKPTAAKSLAAPKKLGKAQAEALKVATGEAASDDGRRTHRYSPASQHSEDELEDAATLHIRRLEKVPCIIMIFSVGDQKG